MGKPYLLAISGNHLTIYSPDIIPTGFSMAILSQSAFKNFAKNSIESLCLPSILFFSKCLAPDTAKI